MSLKRGDIVLVAVWIMADKIVTVPRSALKSEPVGRLDAREMAGLESALRTWLDL